MKWYPITDKTDYIDLGWSLVAVYHLTDTELILIDSGTVPAPEFLADLELRGLTVRAILCSHPHHDHIANNPALYQRYNCEIYVPEEGLTSASEAGYPLYPDTPGLTELPPLIPIPAGAPYLEIDGARLQLIPTPGHMPGHLAIATPDGVCFLGDAVVSPEILPLFKLPYMTDVDQSLESMETIRQTRYPFYLVSHKGLTPFAGLQELVELNVKKELDIYDILRGQITRPLPLEDLVSRFLNALNVSPRKQSSPWIRETSLSRIHSLIRAGEISLEDGIVCPVRSTAQKNR